MNSARLESMARCVSRTQIGIGYMNYRRIKAEGAFDKEKQLWQLERTAIEQFNGLRRELFDTAWRLSATYNYPDELRLTERQIKQYDNILMDTDPFRKYERMMSIKQFFVAYPPFWYYPGRTAVELSISEIGLSDAKKKAYQEEAKEYFTQFRATNQDGLLREDPVACACALEYIDLLDPVQDKKLITELIEEAYRFSGRKEDILQMCAMVYLRIDEQKKAIRILKELINEGYLPHMNGQLLSGIYVSSYITDHSADTLDEYKLLQRQIGPQHLFPMPQGNIIVMQNLNHEFIKLQQQILREKYTLVINKLREKFSGEYSKLIPVRLNCVTDFSA